jgi:3-dehydroquinate synthase
MNNLAPYRGHWEVKTELATRYEIVDTTLLEGNDAALFNVVESGDIGCRLVVVDDRVLELYGDRIYECLRSNKVNYRLITMPGAEEEKTIEWVLKVVADLNDIGTMRRSNPLIAIGGGVILDVAGLAASLYRRGIPYIRVPTTLIGQIDVSVAAKTGVNHGGYRNRLGAYHPPLRTIIDRTFLGTLPRRHVRNGMGEVLKMAMIKDRRLFEILEAYGHDLVEDRCTGPAADEVIHRSITGMIEELQPNLWERDLRRSVDFGHSFSPLVEMRALPDLLHGEAVALDCILSSFLAHGRGLLPGTELRRLIQLTARLGLPTRHPMFADSDLLLEALADTTRHRDGEQNLPLPGGIGRCLFAADVTSAEIKEAAANMNTAYDLPWSSSLPVATRPGLED